MTDDISPLIREKAPLILEEIRKATSILLHCHPSPDPDSVGSALAMKFALEQLGKKATVIKGDSDIPDAFMHFPGAKEIVQKNFFEVDLKEFDLFISLDTASVDRISTLRPVAFPEGLTVVNIDHHATNPGFGKIDLIVTNYPATCQILFDLFTCWAIKIDHEIASNLFIGIYTDTGGFKYYGSTFKTFETAAGLARIIPEFPKIISDMEHANTIEFLRFRGLAFSSVEPLFGGLGIIAAVSKAELDAQGVQAEEASASAVSPSLVSVAGCYFGAALVEVEPRLVKASFRSADKERYDVSKLAASIGGGGHKAAAAVVMRDMSLGDAKALVVAKAKELYNL